MSHRISLNVVFGHVTLEQYQIVEDQGSFLVTVFFEACWELFKSLIELRCLNKCIFKKWGKGKRGENDNPFVPEGTTRLTFPVLISSNLTIDHLMRFTPNLIK